MTKMSNEEIIDVVEAFKNGRQIQYWSDVNGVWIDTDCPAWAFNCERYRVKPEVEKPRPFVNLREFNEYWMKAHVKSIALGSLDIGGIWLTDVITNIQYQMTSVDKEENRIFVAGAWFTMKRLLRDFKFSDGSPCGVLEVN